MALFLIISAINGKHLVPWFKADNWNLRQGYNRVISGAELRYATMLEF